MATPLSATAAVQALQAEGVTVKQYKTWSNHNRGLRGDGWGPVHGVVLHHTVTKGAKPAQTANSVEQCYVGYPDPPNNLPGPLCHGVIDKQGVVHMVGWGRTNHAGLGDSSVMDAVIAERPLPKPTAMNLDGNSRMYGFECINLGDGKDPWPDVQVEAMVRTAAALLRAHGWGQTGTTSVIGHKEWTNTKVDPRGTGGGDMDAIRARVAERLRHPASWSPASAAPATYTVKKGDTLSAISAEFHVPVKKLVSLNKLADPDSIKPGQKLKLK
jgi:nucleoid-associated protein YgaU